MNKSWIPYYIECVRCRLILVSPSDSTKKTYLRDMNTLFKIEQTYKRDPKLLKELMCDRHFKECEDRWGTSK